MKIQSSSLLTGTSKSIQVVNGCIIAKEGPNMISKMGLGDLDINYDSVMTTRQTLKVGGSDTPIMYGFLGTDITFLLVKPIYTTDPMTCTGTTSNYLEYYFEDEPLVRRKLTDILVLTGNDTYRIPQVYLYNPTSSIVTVDIMAANLDENTISTTLVPTFTELTGLAFNVIKSDQIYSTSPLATGSTQFEIYDIDGNVQMVIPYNTIDVMTIVNNLITISTKSDDDIKLTFLSNFNASQALSRMSWAIESSSNRYITTTVPTLDTTAPTISWNPYNVPQVMDYVSGVVSQSAIRTRFIASVTDYDDNSVIRDGSISISDVNLLIIDNDSGEQLSAITYDGNFSVTFTAKDIANNSVSSTKTIKVDETGPTIYWLTGYTTNIMDLTGDTQTPGTILSDDLSRYYINYVWDSVDHVIANSAVTITITSGTTLTAITAIGEYTIDFSVSDTALNTTTATTTLTVTESVAPVIWYNDVFTNSAFTMSLSADTISLSAITEVDIRAYALSAVTDNYDTTLTVNDIILSGTTFAIYNTGDYDIVFTVSDSAGNETTATRGLTVIT